MKRTLKYLSVILALILALSFTACGGGSNEEAPEEGSVGIANPWQTADSAQAAAEGAGIDGFDIAEVVKQFTFFYPTYDVSTSDGRYWKVDGDFFDHEYAVYDGDRMVASVSKDWFTWGDAYRISVSDQVDPILALSIVLVIDACLDAEGHH
jgi:hypothetical protein